MVRYAPCCVAAVLFGIHSGTLLIHGFQAGTSGSSRVASGNGITNGPTGTGPRGTTNNAQPVRTSVKALIGSVESVGGPFGYNAGSSALYAMLDEDYELDDDDGGPAPFFAADSEPSDNDIDEDADDDEPASELTSAATADQPISFFASTSYAAQLKIKSIQTELFHRSLLEAQLRTSNKLPSLASSTGSDDLPLLDAWILDDKGRLVGTVSNHPTYRNGDVITTSELSYDPAAASNGGIVTTNSGSQYRLGRSREVVEMESKMAKLKAEAVIKQREEKERWKLERERLERERKEREVIEAALKKEEEARLKQKQLEQEEAEKTAQMQAEQAAEEARIKAEENAKRMEETKAKLSQSLKSFTNLAWDVTKTAAKIGGGAVKVAAEVVSDVAESEVKKRAARERAVSGGKERDQELDDSVNKVLEEASMAVERAEMALSGTDAEAAAEDGIGIAAEETFGVDIDAASDSVEEAAVSEQDAIATEESAEDAIVTAESTGIKALEAEELAAVQEDSSAPPELVEVAETVEAADIADSLSTSDLAALDIDPTISDELKKEPANAESDGAVPEVVVADELQLEVNGSTSEKVDADLAAAATAAVEEEARILAIEVDRVASEQDFLQIAVDNAKAAEAEAAELAEMQLAEDERIATIEAKRIASEQSYLQIAVDNAKAARAEAVALAAEKAEMLRLEDERIFAIEADRLASEQAFLQIAADNAVKARAEAAEAHAEAARVEAERLEQETAAAAAAKAEQERTSAAQYAFHRALLSTKIDNEQKVFEALRIAAEEEAEAQRLENQRIAAIESNRILSEAEFLQIAIDNANKWRKEADAARAEAARLEAERLQSEAAARAELERRSAAQYALHRALLTTKIDNDQKVAMIMRIAAEKEAETRRLEEERITAIETERIKSEAGFLQIAVDNAVKARTDADEARAEAARLEVERLEREAAAEQARVEEEQRMAEEAAARSSANYAFQRSLITTRFALDKKVAEAAKLRAAQIAKEEEEREKIEEIEQKRLELESLEEAIVEEQTIAAQESPEFIAHDELIDLSLYESAQELCDAVDAETLKNELSRIGLKCGGKPLDRATRLFMTKEMPLDAIPNKQWIKGRKPASEPAQQDIAEDVADEETQLIETVIEDIDEEAQLVESVQAEMARLEEKLQAKIEEENIAAENAERERLEAIAQSKKDEEARIAAEIAEQQRIAAEEERIAAEIAEQERIAAEKAEQERIAAEQAEQERIAAEQAEQERIAAEIAEQERIAAEQAEQERIAAEQAEQERIAAEIAEQERIAAEQAEQERIAAEQAEQERIAAEIAEQERIAAEQAEQERIAAEQAEQERIAAEIAEQERIAAEQAEQERIAAEQAEQERIAAEIAEQERIAAEQAEQERIAAEQAEQARIAAEIADQERIAAEKAEQEKFAAEQAEQERLAAENAEKERLEAQRQAEEETEQARIAAEKEEQDQIAAEKAEQERIEAQRQAEGVAALASAVPAEAAAVSNGGAPRSNEWEKVSFQWSVGTRQFEGTDPKRLVSPTASAFGHEFFLALHLADDKNVNIELRVSDLNSNIVVRNVGLSIFCPDEYGRRVTARAEDIANGIAVPTDSNSFGQCGFEYKVGKYATRKMLLEQAVRSGLRITTSFEVERPTSGRAATAVDVNGEVKMLGDIGVQTDVPPEPLEQTPESSASTTPEAAASADSGPAQEPPPTKPAPSKVQVIGTGW